MIRQFLQDIFGVEGYVRAQLHTILTVVEDQYDRLHQIEKQLRRLTMAITNVTELLQQVDAATTATAERVLAIIEALKNQNGKLTPEQEQEADAIVAHLQAIGSNPDNPIPTPNTPNTTDTGTTT